MHPLPSLVLSNQLLTKIARMNHHLAVTTSYKQMGMFGIVPDLCTLNILINCLGDSNRMDCSLFVSLKLFKLGYEWEVVTLITLMK